MAQTGDFRLFILEFSITFPILSPSFCYILLLVFLELCFFSFSFSLLFFFLEVRNFFFSHADAESRSYGTREKLATVRIDRPISGAQQQQQQQQRQVCSSSGWV